RVLLGIGVTNPVTRHPTVTASALLTLQEASRGRALMGVGVGSTAVRTLGKPPVSRPELGRWVRLGRALGRGGPRAAPAAEPGASAPIVVAGRGPKMLRLAGEIGDGAIVTGSARSGPALRARLDWVQEGRAAAGPPPRAFRTCLSIAAAVHPDRRKAFEAV